MKIFLVGLISILFTLGIIGIMMVIFTINHEKTLANNIQTTSARQAQEELEMLKYIAGATGANQDQMVVLKGIFEDTTQNPNSVEAWVSSVAKHNILPQKNITTIVSSQYRIFSSRRETLQNLKDQHTKLYQTTPFKQILAHFSDERIPNYHKL